MSSMNDTIRPDIDAIKARLNAATPGKWDTHPPSADAIMVNTHNDGRYAHYVGVATSYKPENVAFIIAAHNTDIPALLAYIERLEGGA